MRVQHGSYTHDAPDGADLRIDRSAIRDDAGNLTGILETITIKGVRAVEPEKASREINYKITLDDSCMKEFAEKVKAIAAEMTSKFFKINRTTGPAGPEA